MSGNQNILFFQGELQVLKYQMISKTKTETKSQKMTCRN